MKREPTTPSTRFRIEFDYEKQSVIEVGASILAWVATPPKDNTLSAPLPSAYPLVLWIAHQKAQSDPAWANEQTLPMRCLCQDLSKVETHFHTIRNKIRDGIKSVIPACVMLIEAHENSKLGKESYKSLSIATILDLMASIDLIRDPENFPTRILRPRRSVLHLSLALYITNAKRNLDNLRDIDPY